MDTGQFVMPETLPELEAFLGRVRQDWERREMGIEGFSHLVSNAGIVGGSPSIEGRRIETAYVAHLWLRTCPWRISVCSIHMHREKRCWRLCDSRIRRMRSSPREDHPGRAASPQAG